MHIFWTHIFKSRDVYLLIKGDESPQRVLEGGWMERRTVQVGKKSAFLTSVNLLHFRPAAKQADSSCVWSKFGSVAKQKEEETKLEREKGKASPAHTHAFTQILVLVFESGEVKVLMRAATISTGLKLRPQI